MNTELVKKLIDEAVEQNDLFLVEYTIGADGVIKVLIDDVKGLKLDDCIKVSRHIEHNLDRDEFDFSLEVSSPGLSEPLKVPMQYQKNVGRKLKVETIEGDQFEGTLVAMEGDTIELEWKTREPKPVGKGKVTVTKKKAIQLADIKQSKVVITF